jgi:4-hydroxy-4-methyl-2-oxoglutarate aldolase
MTETYVARLRRLDGCAVSDAMDRLGLAGQVTTLPQRSGSGRIAGRAVTCRLGTGDPLFGPPSGPPPGPPRHLGTTAITLAGPDSVIVVEQRTGIEAGCWGGLLTLGARMRGVAGVIADGPVRDLDEAQALAFPIFTNRTTCLTARGRVVEQETNGPVTIDRVRVEAGDYVLADQSGCLFIKPADIDRVLATAEDIALRETAMARAILAGTPIAEVMGGAYEHMLRPEA